jgi:hypothetical protein
MVAFADGCVGPAIDPKAHCITSLDVGANTLTQHGGIVRQLSGKGLFAAYDPKKPGSTPGSGGNTRGTGTGAGSGGGLADTGSSPTLPLVGTGLLLAGLALGGVLGWRRRTRAVPS